MDINIVREAVTVISFCLFIAIVAWAWSSGNRQRFAEAALLPLDEESDVPAPLHASAPAPGHAAGSAQGEGRPS